jgi:hypothetical protein
MSTLQETISEYRPAPLGEAVQAASTGPGGSRNISQVADELGIMGCPKEDLPPALRKAREDLEESARLKEEAESKVRQGIADWQAYEGALLALKELRADIAGGENLVALCRRDVETLQAEFDSSLKSGRVQAINRVQSALAAREMLKLLPASLKALRTRLNTAEAEIAAMEKQHGFHTSGPRVNTPPQPEAETAQDSAAAFREQQ